MRMLMMALVVIGFLAAPSLGVINVKLTVDNTVLAAIQETTVRIWAQGTSAGIYSLAGSIVASGSGVVSNTGPITFTSAFHPSSLFTPKSGTANGDGGWNNFGTLQTNWASPDPTAGRDDYVEICNYAVAGGYAGYVTLTFEPKVVSGYRPRETDATEVMGLTTPVTIEILPEPATLALLGLGGLVVARRRRA
jgi:hypothetical protein